MLISWLLKVVEKFSMLPNIRSGLNAHLYLSYEAIYAVNVCLMDMVVTKNRFQIRGQKF